MILPAVQAEGQLPDGRPTVRVAVRPSRHTAQMDKERIVRLASEVLAPYMHDLQSALSRAHSRGGVP